MDLIWLIPAKGSSRIIHPFYFSLPKPGPFMGSGFFLAPLPKGGKNESNTAINYYGSICSYWHIGCTAYMVSCRSCQGLSRSACRECDGCSIIGTMAGSRHCLYDWVVAKYAWSRNLTRISRGNGRRFGRRLFV